MASADASQEASADSPPPPPSAGSLSSASAPSLGDSSACCNCPKCRRRMIKPVFDCHTVCFQCRGFDCDLDNCCDECLEWSQEETEASIKHRKLLVRKDKRGKDSLPKPPSSPGPSPLPSQPLILTASDFDSRISNQIAELSLSFDQKLESVTNVLLSKISLLQPSVQSRCQLGCLNISSAAPPVVPVRCPSSGLHPETTGLHQASV